MSRTLSATATISVTKSESFVITNSGEYTFELKEPGVELQVIGLFKARARQRHDVTVVIHHCVPHTKATTTLKAVATDSGSIRFVGRIIIDRNCPDTNSFLTERVLLLSDQAQAETVPDLEIESDDVSCSHAASISRVSPEQLFYLRSRGLSESAAEKLLRDGFLAEKR
jgi:Fe-S cluster assembly protein SufD